MSHSDLASCFYVSTTYFLPYHLCVRSIYWDYAMNVKVDEIVYVHCHQQGECGSKTNKLKLLSAEIS